MSTQTYNTVRSYAYQAILGHINRMTTPTATPQRLIHVQYKAFGRCDLVQIVTVVVMFALFQK